MPINMPTRVNRVPRLGQPAPLATSGQPAPLISGEADAHKKLSDFMNAMASGNLAEAKRAAGVPRLGQPTHYSSPTTTSYGLVDTHVPPSPTMEMPPLRGATAAAGNAASGIGAAKPRRQSMYQNPGNQATFSGVMKPIGGMAQGSSLAPIDQNANLSAYDAHTAGLPQTANGGLAPFTTNFNHPGYADHVASEQAAQDARSQFRSGLGQRPASGIPQVMQSSTPQQQQPINGYSTLPLDNLSVGNRQINARRQLDTDNLLAAHRQQQMRNGYTQWDRDQLRLGGAKQPDIVQSQEAPTLPTTSQFSPPREGYNEVNGGTAVQNGRGSRLIGSALMQQFTDAGNSAADLVPGSANYANAKRSLDALTSQAENARIAAQTAAGGGLSRAGQYDQRQKDIKALRYAKQKPTSLAFREAMGRINEKQNKADFTRQLQQKALTAHLATMTPQQQMQYLAAGSAAPAAPIQTQQQPAFNFGLGGSNLPGPAHGWPDMSPMLPAAPPPTTLDTPPRRSAMPDFGQPMMPGRRWGGF